MIIKHNFNKLNLLKNNIIELHFDNKIIKIQPPTLEDYYLNIEFQMFMMMLKQDINEILKRDPNFPLVVETPYELIQAFIMLNLHKETLIRGFQKITPELTFDKNELTYNNIKLTSEEFDYILKVLWVSCGELEFDKTIKDFEPTTTQKLSEVQQKLLDHQKRIDDAKAKKNKKQQNDKSNITIENIVLAILYEFPSFTSEDVYKMNMFTIYYLWQLLSRVVDNQIQIVAAGNGNIKDFTYFIN